MPVILNSPYKQPVLPFGNDSFTKLLIHSDTTSGSIVATDSSASVHTSIIMDNGAHHSSLREKFGISSMRLVGTDRYIGIPDHNDWSIGNGDFTIDVWVNFETFDGQGQVISSHFNGGASNNKAWSWQYADATGEFSFIYTTNGATNNFLDSTSTIALSTNVWYHLAIVRDGTNIKYFVDGNQIGSNLNIGTDTIYNSSTSLKIGALEVGGSIFTLTAAKAFFDEYRFSKGIARWTSNFTPPTAPYG